MTSHAPNTASPRAMPEPQRLLVVCLGNICRSPMAEGAIRARLQAAGLGDDVVVDSAGIGAWHVGEPPDPRAITTAARYGVDLSGLRARQLQADDFQHFDWLLCADRGNLRDLSLVAPTGATARSSLLLPWAGMPPHSEIPDPYAGGPDDFERVWRLVDAAAVAIVDRYPGPWDRQATAGPGLPAGHGD